MMVFGEYPQGYLPQLFIACVVIPGRKLGDVGELGQDLTIMKELKELLKKC